VEKGVARSRRCARSNSKIQLRKVVVYARDGNSGTGTRPEGYEYVNEFLPADGTNTRPELRWVRGVYFFPSDGYPILYYRYNSRL
jgi:hypothetical protein